MNKDYFRPFNIKINLLNTPSHPTSLNIFAHRLLLNIDIFKYTLTYLIVGVERMTTDPH